MTNHDPDRTGGIADPVEIGCISNAASLREISLDFSISPDPLLSLQSDGTILSVNQRTAEMFNCHGRLMIGTHIGAFLEGLPDTDGKPNVARLIEAFAVGDGSTVETVAHKLNGDSVTVEITTSLYNQDGKQVVVAALRDITHRKHSERALTKAKEQAERANVAKLDFLGQLSHELRTPLAAVIGFGEVMRDEMFGPIGIKLYQTYAADICKSGRQLADVIERIIDVTRLEGRMAIAHARTADLAEIVERVLATHAGAAAVQGVRLTHNLRRGSIPVVLDDETLAKMIGHIVENAIKFNHFGGKTEIVGAMQTAKENDTPQVVLTVTDNGPGFATNQLRRLQSSIDANQHHTSGGLTSGGLASSGLASGGLALCGAFLHLIGGKLSICSAPNLGTTATLMFPQRFDGCWHP